MLAWIGYVVTGRPAGGPSPRVMWIAIVVAALLFGAGYLPAASASGTPLIARAVARIVTLNAVGGLAFGWLFRRRSLETAMVAHATVHVV